MARKLIVCMDGTGNQISDQQTNVLRLYRCLKIDSDTQKTIYIPGVGTNSAQTVMGAYWQKFRGLLGLAFGLGLEDNVLTAYRFLCETYEDGDEIICFGFSRGAYAIRVLAGFINNFGLLPQNQLHLAVRAFRAYREITDSDVDEADNVTYQSLRRYEQVLHVRHVPVRFLGLFDTVSSMIRFRRIWHNLKTSGSLLEFGTHASVDENPSVEMVRHAISIDERRSFFRAQHWIPGAYYGNRFKSGTPKPQDVVQQWFPGFHSDIGGAPFEDRAGIGKITLLWMIDALSAAGIELEFVRNRVGKYIKGENPDKRTPGGRPYSKPSALAEIHDSMTSVWPVLEVFPKSRTRREPPKKDEGFLYYLPLSEQRTIPDTHQISQAALIRREKDPKYDPPNLPRLP